METEKRLKEYYFKPKRQLITHSTSTDATMLTIREREVLTRISAGLSNKEIASNLNISENTVKTYVYKIYKKINVPNRFQAILWGLKNMR